MTVPVTPPDSTLIVAVPGERACTCPVDGSTSATRGSLLDHTCDAGSAIGTWSAARSSPVGVVPVAVSCSFAPIFRVGCGAVTAMRPAADGHPGTERPGQR